MKNIAAAFRYVRGFTIVVVLSCVGITAYVVYHSFASVNRMQDKVYVLVNGKALEVLALDRKDNVGVEARDHIMSFHHYFFTLSPDDKVIKNNVTKALYLADNSAKRSYDDLKEKGYYSGIISGNVSQTLAIDSVVVDVTGYPYHFRCYAKQQIIRSTSIVYRSLITEGALRNVSRSDNNPHGFLIERWTTIDNRDLTIAERK